MIDTKLRAYLEPLVTEKRKQKFLDILKNRTKHFTVVLEDVYQMHNTSAVIRSCDVFGIQQAHAIEVQHKNVLDKQIALGAQKWVDLKYHSSQDACIEELKADGYQIIATTPHENSCYLKDFDITKKSALFFGSEKDGISETVLQKADGFLKIPMVGFTESLNISVSAAIILQSITQKLRESEVNWQLSEDELEYYQLHWMKKTIKSIDKVMKRYNELNNIK
ncbi:TrmH family RNA methyltransferase [Pseudofulvibacter geojedonensis]|uniref:tRNA (guanosine(18)-2'-O)-methyltransferase n=1 Tax=Pseudofulvibacter geojedonensis TaxID=1123758 RepID=A0ABW3HZE9_9FLAO